MVEWILFASMVIMWLAVGFSSLKRTDKEYFSIKVPEAYREDPKFKAIQKSYNRAYRVWFIGAGLACLPIFYDTVYFSITYIYFCLYLVFMPLAQVAVFYRGNQAMRRLKAERAWSAGSGFKRQVDISAYNPMAKIPGHRLVYGLALVIMGLPLALKGMSPAGLVATGLSIMVTLVAIILYRLTKQRPYKLYTDKSQVNLAVNQQIQSLWLRVILFCLLGQVTLNTSTSLLWTYRALNLEVLILLYVALSTLIVLLVFMVGLVSSKRIEGQVKAEDLIQVDDEDFWVAGIYYANPHDPRSFVDKKSGLGRTMNLGTKKGRLSLACLSLFIVLVLGGAGLMTISHDLVPHQMTFKDQEVVIDSMGYGEKIPLDAIQSVELLQDVTLTLKLNGIGTDLYSRGAYDTEDQGRCRVYIFKGVYPIIKITTKDQVYLYTDESHQETMATYRELMTKIN